MFLAAGLIVVSSPASAERWLLLSENEIWRLSVDADSLKAQGAGLAFKYLLAHPVAYENTVTGRRYKAVRVEAVMDCAAGTMLVLAIESYASETGNLIGRVSVPDADRKPHRIVAGGTDDILRGYVCQRSKPR